MFPLGKPLLILDCFAFFQDPNEDTEWNDILRSKGILPPKEPEITEESLVNMVEQAIEKKLSSKNTKSTVDFLSTFVQNEKIWNFEFLLDEKQKSDMDLDELDELEDSEDEAIIQEYRNKRIREMKALAERSKFGTVREISGQDYVNEVNKAGEGIYVVLHLYERGIPLCALINQFMVNLATRNPEVKFLKSIATTCIPNFPEKNLPSVFIYYEGQLQKQIIGPVELRGEKLTLDEFEYMLGQYGAIKTEIKEDPRQQVKDKMFSDLADTNDWWLLPSTYAQLDSIIYALISY